MRNLFILFLFLISFLITHNVFASSVVINEVMFDPGENDTGQEWIELYNSSENVVDLSGWQVYPDGIGYYTIPSGFLLGSRKFVVIHLRLAGNNSTIDLYHTTTSSSNMSDTAGSVALFSGEPRGKDTMKSFMQWGRGGETWESDADKADLWIKDTFVDISSFIKGYSLALNEDGMSAGGKTQWNISQNPTVGVSHTATVAIIPSVSPLFSPASTLPSVASSPLSSAPSSVSQLIPSIKAYAGVDRSAMVGTHLEFLGHGMGIHDEPIDNLVRFFWNFGDGETQEGRSVAHIYRMPGTYIAGVHISSGAYTASDYIHVNIIPNLVSISDVVLGIDGYVRIINASDIDADISGWSMRDAKGNTFVIPPRTLVGLHATIALPNNVTGLLKEPEALPANIFYPNGVSAFIYSGTHVVSGVEKQEDPKPLVSLRPVIVEKVEKQEKKKDPAIIAESKSSSVPDLIPDNSDTTKELGTAVSHVPLISTPLVMALIISMFGAIGFFVLKQYL